MDSYKIKRGLGRGLSSLIGDTKIENQKNRLSVTDLIPNKYQPRKIFDKESLNELSSSIRERGILQPIIVRKSNDDRSKYEIIAGERRWLAAQKVGLHDVPVVITEADDLKSLEFAIVENIQRHDLNPLEEAQGYKKLIESQKLSAGHAKILVGLENASFVATKIIENKLSVRQAENFVKLFKNKRQKTTNSKDANIMHLEMSIVNKVGLNVEIKNKKNNKGKISFEYKNLDQLNKIIDIIKSNY